MKRKHIESTTLLSAGYDARRQLLELEFISREVYRYFKVPQKVYDELLKADSAGAYFNSAIRDNFLFEKAV